MSRFPNQQSALNYALRKVQEVARAGAKTVVRRVYTHTHTSDDGEGGVPGYTPAATSSWNGNVDPGNLAQAVDQLALRVQALENLSIPASLTQANTMLFNGME